MGALSFYEEITQIGTLHPTLIPAISYLSLNVRFHK